ncbi:MAG: methionine adenosyltransferase [Eubacterium sp.]|nr:methionine adenosyltransferase [Eubacterium sp.]
MGKYYLLTSESVTEGHPDKLCDIVSDTLLDAYLEQDPQSHVAMETVASKNMIFLSGEVTSKAKLDIVKKVREAVLEIGYDGKEKGLDGNNCLVLTNVISQSPDIAQGVNQTDGLIGAGDQGMMYGYACDDTEEYMPLSISLAHKLTKRLTYVRKSGILPYLYPDGKSQVTVAYDDNGNVVGIQTVVISTQHSADVDIEQLRADVKREVIDAVIDGKDMLPDVKIHINPTGRFVVGGPEGDTGLTGRKIIVDTYGGIARHGGGAFSGKDPTKVDRSAAYMARYAAVNVVAAGLCRKCEVNLAYAIGVPDPVSVKIDTFGTEEIPKAIIEQIVEEVFDFSVAGIINNLSLTSVTYKPVAAYGHFGRPELDLPWERTDKVDALQKKAISYIADAIISAG